MKRLILAVLMIFCSLAVGSAYAQEWTWNDPVPITLTTPTFTPPLKEMAVDASSDAIYGIDESGNFVSSTEITLGDPVAGQTSAISGSSAVKDIAVGLAKHVFMCSEIMIKEFDPLANPPSFTDLTAQPLLPLKNPLDPGQGAIAGIYSHIAIGKGGKLYVLYDTEGGQYLLIGNPPVTTDGVVVEIRPETLNLSSKGNWVGCRIHLPGGDENDIDPDSLMVREISIPSEGLSATTEIGRAPGSPWSVEIVDGKRVLKLKFPRYNKLNPTDSGSVIGVLKDLMKDLKPKPFHYYQVTLTVEGAFKSDSVKFSGTDEIRVKKHK